MKDIARVRRDRREFLKRAAVGVAGGLGVSALPGCRDATPVVRPPQPSAAPVPPPRPEVPLPELTTEPLSFPWVTSDPFLFCAYHQDLYPAGDARQAPEAASLAGRQLGSDFSRLHGWSMYHGQVVPGFPRHPHRGFETITVARRGFCDHSDSLGATARFGGGDAQWMTAGRGIVHAEMFPLRRTDGDNPLELFQLWLNLPRRSKMVEPYFTMFWHEQIPVHRIVDDAGRVTVVVTVAGALDGRPPPSPPPDSRAADPAAEIAVWTIDLDPGARWSVPPASPGISRSLYFHRGSTLGVAGRTIAPGTRVQAPSDLPLPLEAGSQKAEALLLQGRPLGEPVAHYGPFVMNTREELQQAYADYQRGGFGRWPWPDDAPVHPRNQGRFALHADGRREEPA